MVIFDRIPKETNREYAFRLIKENIIGLGLEPGAFVGEQEIANLIGLSRTPVHEALLDLSKTKIVEIYPQRGSRIALIDYDLLIESSFIRRTMETAVAELACSMATEEDLLNIEENVKLQEFYLTNPTGDKLMELDNEFHKSLYTIANKEQSYYMVSSMSIHLNRIRNMSLTTVKDLKIVGDHRAILEAFKSRNSEAVVALLEKHLSRYRCDIDLIIKKYPQYFAPGPWEKLSAPTIC